MNINFDDAEANTLKTGGEGWIKETTSEQVIITHPSLLHCDSHLGLIKTLKIGLIITCKEKHGWDEEENIPKMDIECDKTTKKWENGSGLEERNENKAEAFLMLL